MILNKPGDYSPAPGLKYTVALKAGQKVTSTKSGGYESDTYLKISGPFDGTAAATDDKAGAKTNENDGSQKEGKKTTADSTSPVAMEDVLNND